jgi:hypothetical protein
MKRGNTFRFQVTSHIMRNPAIQLRTVVWPRGYFREITYIIEAYTNPQIIQIIPLRGSDGNAIPSDRK